MKLNKEERELLDSIEKDEWRSIGNLEEEVKRSRSIARATGTKDERMNIRMNRRDMMALKARALEQGMPYQTLVSSILREWLRRESAEVKTLIRFEWLFSAQELQELAPLLKKYLERPRNKSILVARDASGAFQPRPALRDSLLDRVSSGDPKTFAEVELTEAEAAQLFERLGRIQGKPGLSDVDRRLLEAVLRRLSLVIPPINP